MGAERTEVAAAARMVKVVKANMLKNKKKRVK